MPGQHGRRPKQPPSAFRTMLDDMLGSGVQYVVETVKQAAPKCEFCGAATILRCASCGQVVCNAHGFINYRAIDKVTTLCCDCVHQAFPAVDLQDPRPQQQRQENWPYTEKPWKVLGIHAFSTDEEIEKAYKRLARDAHPDHGGSEELMKKLNAARAYMMGRRKKRS
jgi:hypothetical protein